MQLKKISDTNKFGALYKIQGEYPKFILSDVTTKFGVETNYNNKIIKWLIEDVDRIKLAEIENKLLEDCKELGGEFVETKLLYKIGFKPMLITKIRNKCTANDILTHEEGDILSFDDIKKNVRYNVSLVIKNISIKDGSIYYNFEIIKIKNSQ